jgi:hypothetical protein
MKIAIFFKKGPGQACCGGLFAGFYEVSLSAVHRYLRFTNDDQEITP